MVPSIGTYVIAVWLLCAVGFVLSIIYRRVAVRWTLLFIGSAMLLVCPFLFNKQAMDRDIFWWFSSLPQFSFNHVQFSTEAIVASTIAILGMMGVMYCVKSCVRSFDKQKSPPPSGG